MATYVIGDVQGCWNTLQKLLTTVDYNPQNDSLICAGDLVNRGPNSLAVLRWAMKNDVKMVLGNHDIYLLSLWAGVVARKDDGLDALLTAPDAPEMCLWLRRRSLAIAHQQYVVIHAALDPDWSENDAMMWARAIETELEGPGWVDFLRGSWDKFRRKNEPIYRALAYLTRGRGLTQNGGELHPFKGAPEDAPSNWRAWYDFPRDEPEARTIVFGHWAALGYRKMAGFVSLDGGAVWGGELVALRLEDGHVFRTAACAGDVYASPA